MRGKELMVDSVKSGLEVGALAVGKVVRQAENMPVAGRIVELGRYVTYRVGTRYVLDGMVRYERRKIQAGINDDILITALRGAGQRRASKESLAELSALKRFVDVYGPTTYEELQEVTGIESEPPQDIVGWQLMKIMADAEKQQRRLER